MDPQRTMQNATTDENVLARKMHRRNFLRFTGTAASVGLLVSTGCTEDYAPGDGPGEDIVNLGSGDFGVLNYAYALEQLEAAFYTQVMATPFSGMTALETAMLTDIRDHEIAHREFFKTALMTNAIRDLQVNFSAINFSDRNSVLSTAKAFEDLGVSAYNGAGKLLTSGDFLTIAGKIVSVEARHAALIRDLITPGSFAASDVVNAQGLDVVRTPQEVLAIAQTFLVTKLNGSNLPTE
jgi:hypothetical protein